MKVDAVKRTRYQFIEVVAAFIGRVLIIRVQQDIVVGAHGMFVDNGVQHLLFHIVLATEPTHINDIGSKLRD